MKYLKIFESSKIEITIDELADMLAVKLGHRKAFHLATGSEGVVYEISENLILKMTNSAQEANMVKTFIGKNFEYITNYYKVFKIGSDTHKILTNTSKLRQPYLADIFCIVAEKCSVNSNIPKIVTEIQNVMIDSGIKLTAANFFKNILNPNNLPKIEKYFKSLVLSPFLHFKSKDEFYKYYQDCVDIAKEMKDNDIINLDGHAWNFGLKNEHLCIFDILNKKKYSSELDTLTLDKKIYIN